MSEIPGDVLKFFNAIPEQFVRCKIDTDEKGEVFLTEYNPKENNNMSTYKVVDMTLKMSKEQAEEYLIQILDHVNETLNKKGIEYIRNEDYMHNFNVGAKMKGTLRENVMDAFRLKHEISRRDIIGDIEKGHELPSKEVIFEKYGDIINYYVLEMMSMLHRIDEEN